MSAAAEPDSVRAGGRPVRVGIVGAGWAGLACAVRAVQAGHRVTVFEAATPGGRARSVELPGGAVLDNGQHILIGAYTRTLALMRTVGVDPARALERRALALVDARGHGLVLPHGAPVPAFVRGVLGHRGWPLSARLALLARCTAWAVRGFRCPPDWTAAHLARGLPETVRRELIEPLCVAALNTPAPQASAAVLLRVLRDALFSGPGSADLLLPRLGLSELLPRPASRWLAAHGADLREGCRVESLHRDGGTWRLAHGAGDEPFDRVVLATPPREAARLCAEAAPAWADVAQGLHYEPIVTVFLDSERRLPGPMIALADGPQAPGQFVFDLDRLGLAPRRLALVASGATAWVERGQAATAEAAVAQLQAALGHPPGVAPAVLKVMTEKRATFRCTPGLHRPPMHIGPGLLAAGDHVDGPYPATLEGAVRSGEAAAAALAA
jgi:squalene-associated FAD-dependent desaturase